MNKPLTITIEPPITEHCSKCDYEDSRSFIRFLYKCPICGERINHGARPPEKRSIRVVHYEGSFNWANPSEKQWQYVFCNVPNGKKYSFVVDDEYDVEDPIELALYLKEDIDKYWFNSDKEKIAELVKLIDTEECQEEQETLRNNEKRIELERELYKLNALTRCYDD